MSADELKAEQKAQEKMKQAAKPDRAKNDQLDQLAHLKKSYALLSQGRAGSAECANPVHAP
jgi:hypothetical protein